MTYSEKLTVLRTMVGDLDTDEVLSTYLKISGAKILAKAYPYDETVEEVPKKYSVLQCEIAAYLLNKRGAEGQISHSENGISRAYENADVPPSMLKTVTSYCGVVK
ncbi:phage head-tail connector protein [Criibacterium bergeronii]|uniref:DNA-packaging protein n=1 Tax=Criibacterium bergeronii TaxID=1871336 RepID=A0A1C0AG54_9FIRM|nr:phage head-tail connector protein [Criibacterium bergeronii]RDY21437.1 DNA-packaging protein [Criibacterium bergeronii]